MAWATSPISRMKSLVVGGVGETKDFPATQGFDSMFISFGWQSAGWALYSQKHYLLPQPSPQPFTPPPNIFRKRILNKSRAPCNSEGRPNRQPANRFLLRLLDARCRPDLQGPSHRPN